ncbi:hypothetical protein BC833DRAFT_588221 [Globomyces pollinis-pini]|nr:hypothetical protein BC833DRAFT_588221 [Globomyces pollinis-pini]
MLLVNNHPESIALGYFSIALCTIALLLNVGHFIYLITGSLNHSTMSLKLVAFPIFGSILLASNIVYFFVAEEIPGQLFVSNFYLSFLTDTSQFALSFGHIYLSTELLRVLYSLTDFWTIKRINILQWTLFIYGLFGFVGLMVYICSGGITKTSKELEFGFIHKYILGFFFTATLGTAIYDFIQGLYFVKKLYNLLKEKQSKSNIEQREKLSIQYYKVCFLIIATFLLDFFANIFGVLAVMASENRQLLFRSLCGIGNSQFSLRAILFTKTFINIRDLKIVSMSVRQNHSNDIHGSSKHITNLSSIEANDTFSDELNTPFEDVSLNGMLGFNESQISKPFVNVGSEFVFPIIPILPIDNDNTQSPTSMSSVVTKIDL